MRGISKTRILFWGGVGGLKNSPEGLHCEKKVKKGFETKYDSKMTGFLTGVLKNIIEVCIKLCRSFFMEFHPKLGNLFLFSLLKSYN